MSDTYDFSGWATKNNLRCSDGRVIRQDAFKANDGDVVPLVWNHDHKSAMNVLGNVTLKNKKDGVYAYGKFNDTDQGRNAKALVEHGDITGLSIYANQLEQSGGDVLHGSIKEVSLVLAGANPGATIEDVIVHSDDGYTEVDDGAKIWTGDSIELYHADTASESSKNESEDKKVADNGKTVGDVINTMNEEQKNVMYALIAQAMDENSSDDEDEDEGDEEVKHNVFESDEYTGDYLSHADMEGIFADAKRCGSLKEAVENSMDNGVLAHAIDTTGMTLPDGNQIYDGTQGGLVNRNYGFVDPEFLFPDARSLNNPPEWIKRDTDWVSVVMNGTHHTPFSRIKSVFANITEDEARAKGYLRGHRKKTEIFTLLKRTTDPQTIYKLQKMDRDDIIDITDFDVVAWIRGEMRMMLDEEIARAILIGDGRNADEEDKIQEQHIRPILKDDPLFTIQCNYEYDPKDNDDNDEKIYGWTYLGLIDAIIRSRKDYKGSGTPTFFTTEEMLTNMLLIRNMLGEHMYKSEAELATALRVSKIVTVPVMENYKFADDENKELVGLIVNLADYNVGADKGGAVNMFDDFDIDYNQQKYLIETRCSGALTKPYSAIAVTMKDKTKSEATGG